MATPLLINHFNLAGIAKIFIVSKVLFTNAVVRSHLIEDVEPPSFLPSRHPSTANPSLIRLSPDLVTFCSVELNLSSGRCWDLTLRLIQSVVSRDSVSRRKSVPGIMTSAIDL
jgi:hypothetical protein